ncbi:peptidase family protein [Sarocladium implicatum]|nr:peptidase family protein [Sarocladium implicatum]
MAPGFLKELRRRSRASFRTEHSTDTSSEGAVSHGTAPSSGSVTPPSVAQQSDPALNLQLKRNSGSQSPLPQSQSRPTLVNASNNSSRYSVSGMSGLGSPSSNGKQNLPVSPYAPRVHNLTENAWVYQKVLLIYGSVGEQPIDGTVTVSRLDDNFPPVSWPVCESHFKSLLYLQPGRNRLRFDFSSPKLTNNSTTNPIHSSFLTVHMLPSLNTPPLQLAILLAKDSPGTYDATPARAEREGNGLDTAVRKFRMAAYLWQAFTAEQMWRNKFGRRSFRFEEEWSTGSANYRDLEQGTMRSEAKIHIIRTDKTVAELRDLNKAQQHKPATDKNALHSIAMDAAREYFKPKPGQTQYVSMLLLDAHWDTEHKVVTGHAALGSGSGDIRLGIFGSHCLHSYPSSFEEVVPAFTDCTPTDLNHVANDCNDGGSSWEAANIGIGAHLHEVGHALGCPHQESGIMLRDYVVLNRSFVPREAYSTRTQTKGGLVLQSDECGWHRLDMLRFRTHPVFRLPNDPPMNQDTSVQAFRVEGGSVMAMAATGISFVEIFAEKDDTCHAWLEFPLDHERLQRQVALNESELRAKLSPAQRKGKMKISIKCHGGGSITLDDFTRFASKDSTVKIPGGPLSGGTAYMSRSVGASKTEGSQPQELIFTSTIRQDRVMSRIVIFSGSALDGIEFVFDDETTQLFGNRKERGDTFELDVRRGEYITGFFVRAGYWIDGIQILTSTGRRSRVYGNAHGGDGHTLIPPRGYTICGVAGTCGLWLDGFSVLVRR